MATILIVDDLAANREFLVKLLSEQGHRLLQATEGRQGLATVKAEHPDLVITDVLMPVMDGYEFVRQLRLDPATSRTPVLFYTAPYGEREARALALSSGLSYVLTKPGEPEEVLKIVSQVLSGAHETPALTDGRPVSGAGDREQLRLLTATLSDKAEDLRAANARLRALINIGLDLASRPDSRWLLQRVCSAAQDLFGASYVTLGLVSPDDGTVQRIVSCGVPAAGWIKPGEPVPGILGAVLAERRTFRGDNPDGDPAGLQLPSAHPAVHAFLAAPLASSARVYGWICLVSNEGRAFTEDDEDLVMALSGQVGRIYELEHEMLERQQAEASLRRERDRSQRYLDTAEVILLALDLDGAITLINRKGCDLLGWTEAELLGQNWIDTCVPERMRDELRAKFVALIGGKLAIFQNPVLTRSGVERMIEWRNTVLPNHAGHGSGTFSSGADITEQHQAVEDLRAAEERTRFALQGANVGIWDQDFTLGTLRWSDTLEGQYGLAPGTFGGTFDAFIACVHPDDRERVVETIGKAMKSGADFRVFNRALWPDGSVRWLNGAGRIHLGPTGEPVRGLGISLDVTENRSLEAQFQQAQKLEALGRLAGGVAHDFNNLLTAILGYCELLLTDFDPADPRGSDIAEIQKAGMSAARLTRQLLAFSRKEIIEPIRLNLSTVVDGMRTMLERLIGEDVRVVLALRPDLADVKADRGQVEQIILNLALNARDAMPKGGRLTIETANVTLDENYPKTHLSVQPGFYVVLTVTDTGSGMTPEVQSRLFEPFFTTKEPGKGTGLGLATVHGIVMRSGGSINVYSEIGRGSSFKVYLPRADAAEVQAEATPHPVRSHDGVHTVLVVEDAEGLRELTRRLLERQGYTVLLAANAVEALKQFDQHPSIDVVLTDVVMPGASGPELVSELVERHPALRVIFMSGYTEESIVHHGVLNPGVAFLHKPFSSDSLDLKLREVLDRPLAVPVS